MPLLDQVATASYQEEPIIAVNGKLLTAAQAAAVRIAVAGFLTRLGPSKPGEEVTDPGPQCRIQLSEVQLLMSALPPTAHKP